MTIEISEPKNADQRESIQRLLNGYPHYRRGTDPIWLVDVPDRDEPRLVIVNLNLIPGVTAKAYGAFA